MNDKEIEFGKFKIKTEDYIETSSESNDGQITLNIEEIEGEEKLFDSIRDKLSYNISNDILRTIKERIDNDVSTKLSKDVKLLTEKITDMDDYIDAITYNITKRINGVIDEGEYEELIFSESDKIEPGCRIDEKIKNATGDYDKVKYNTIPVVVDEDNIFVIKNFKWKYNRLDKENNTSSVTFIIYAYKKKGTDNNA